MRFTVLVLLLSSIVFAQDAGQTQQIAVQQAQQAQQIAVEQTQQAQQATIRAGQETTDANLRANQQTMDAAAATNTNPPAGSAPSSRVTRTPKFSPKPGTFKGIAPQVTITVASKDAVIYYTTDGSTPTVTSSRYTGPIKLSRSTTLKAMAVASASGQSATAQGIYVLK